MDPEQLRRAVPTLPRSADLNIMGVAKPDEGTVSGAASKCIKRTKSKRNAARAGVESLVRNSCTQLQGR
jgi:hypothetical protein